MNIFKPMNLITLLVSLYLAACSGSSSDNAMPKNEATTASAHKATVISEDEFKTLVMDYEANTTQWTYNGKLPCIVDFYADWCGPCKRIAPVLDELAREYAGKINILKVNVDKSRTVSAYFGIQSIPTMLFCPMSGKPALQVGGMSKDQLISAIENFLLKKEEQTKQQ